MRELWLASGSPRRARLLEQVGVPFRRLPAPDIDESVHPGESAQAYVWRMAVEKARVGWQNLTDSEQHQAAVMGADTSVVLAGEVLGKPEGQADALRMLARLGGSEHQVISAVSLVWDGQQETRVSTTVVRFRALSEADRLNYAATGEGLDKAGGYGIQGMGALLVDSIQGSYSGVVGLPLEQLPELFGLARVAFWRSPDNGA